MFIKRFEVRGFKNLIAPVVLDELGEINVLHGDNNVGKSNVLEAMHLFFRLMSPDIVLDDWLLREPFPLAEHRFTATGYASTRVFNVFVAAPIRMTCTIRAEPTELLSAGLDPRGFFEEVTVDLELRRNFDRIDFTLIDMTSNTGVSLRHALDADHMASRFFAIFGSDAAWQATKIDAAFSELKLAAPRGG